VILFALCGALVLVIARVCGTSVETLLDLAAGATGVLCGFTSAAYFVLLAGVDGRTAGAWLCRVPHSRPAAPLDLTAVVRRGALAWVEQASIVVDLLLHADRRGLGAVRGWIDVVRRYRSTAS
jgi:hypothetical protein